MSGIVATGFWPEWGADSRRQARGPRSTQKILTRYTDRGLRLAYVSVNMEPEYKER